MRYCSPFATAYQMMHEVENELSKALSEERPPLEVHLVFDTDQRDSSRRYAPPRCTEVAAITVGNQTTGFSQHFLGAPTRG